MAYSDRGRQHCREDGGGGHAPIADAAALTRRAGEPAASGGNLAAVARYAGAVGPRPLVPAVEGVGGGAGVHPPTRRTERVGVKLAVFHWYNSGKLAVFHWYNSGKLAAYHQYDRRKYRALVWRAADGRSGHTRRRRAVQGNVSSQPVVGGAAHAGRHGTRIQAARLRQTDAAHWRSPRACRAWRKAGRQDDPAVPGRGGSRRRWRSTAGSVPPARRARPLSERRQPAPDAGPVRPSDAWRVHARSCWRDVRHPRRGASDRQLAAGGQGRRRPARPAHVRRVGIVERRHIRKIRIPGRARAAPGDGPHELLRVPPVRQPRARRGCSKGRRGPARGACKVGRERESGSVPRPRKGRDAGACARPGRPEDTPLGVHAVRRTPRNRG